MKLFEFPKAYVELRYPPISNISQQPGVLWIDDLPANPSIEPGETADVDEINDEDSNVATAENCELALASSNAALQHCCLSTITIPMTKRGSLTLPPSLRRKMGLDKLRNPMVVVEERDGGLFLQTAVAMPVRDLPKGTIEQWIARDEADMAAFRATPRKTKR